MAKNSWHKSERSELEIINFKVKICTKLTSFQKKRSANKSRSKVRALQENRKPKLNLAQAYARVHYLQIQIIWNNPTHCQLRQAHTYRLSQHIDR